MRAPDAPGRLAATLALPLLVLLAACATEAPITPYPEVADVPNPVTLTEAQATPERLDDLLERYSTSPNRNPDGLGVLASLWLNSRMTLVTWPTALAREQRNRVAYARSAGEQARVLAEARTLYAEHWVFEGVLLGDVPRAVSVDFYLPDGIYLVDDRGRKFRPEVAKDVAPLTTARASSSFGQAHYAWPRLVFPREAIGPQTRAVFLYFAALNKRLRFAWVFDPAYTPPDGGAGLDSGRETNRLFPPR